MSLPPIFAPAAGAAAPAGKLGEATQAVLALGIVGATLYQFIHGGTVAPELLVLASAIVSTYFVGSWNRQVNGTRVDALTAAVGQYHASVTAALGTPAATAPAPAPPSAVASPAVAAPGADPYGATA